MAPLMLSASAYADAPSIALPRRLGSARVSTTYPLYLPSRRRPAAGPARASQPGKPASSEVCDFDAAEGCLNLPESQQGAVRLYLYLYTPFAYVQ